MSNEREETFLVYINNRVVCRTSDKATAIDAYTRATNRAQPVILLRDGEAMLEHVPDAFECAPTQRSSDLLRG